MSKVHICGIPNGPYRYGGFYFEVHPYIGPAQLKRNGEPVSREPPAGFWRMWDTFSQLSQAEKDRYAA